MKTLLIYSPQTSPRLKYVFDWLFTEQLGLNYIITRDAFAEAQICYGTSVPNALCIPDACLLWQQGTTQQTFATGTWNFMPTLYHNAPEGFHLPFDIFSSLFFLLSRYEEYYPFTADKHGRYPASDSAMFHLGLERPIIDEWVTAFAEMLQKFKLPLKQKEFSFIPTYDIDIAWSYKHKGVQRNIGGLVKDIWKGKLHDINARLSALAGIAQDPYDSFDWMSALHRQYRLSPIYFMLVAQQTGSFDKNIDPAHSAMQVLIKDLSAKAIIGIHPSYNSVSDNSLIAAEKNLLANTTGKKIDKSRQHYIKFDLPGTYRALIKNNITDDYSMGYATHLGFRAGTGSSFLWYDLEEETTTQLRIHPFCFMDTTARFDMQLSVEESFKRLAQMTIVLQRTNSTLITIFHNFSLGTGTEWNGWKNAYGNFVSKQ